MYSLLVNDIYSYVSHMQGIMGTYVILKLFYPIQLDSIAADWRAMPPMPSPRCLFSMGECENLLFAIAGKDLETNESLDSVICYDTEYEFKSFVCPPADSVLHT